MNIRIVSWFALIFSLFFSPSVLAGDPTCYGNKSTTSYFACTSVGNCTWWAAAKRPDLAAAIVASNIGGWNGGDWYDKLKSNYPVGSVPKLWAIVEFSSPGHVAYVEKVNPDGSFDVSEMDSTGSFGSGGLYYATYHPDGNGKYHRNNGTPGGWTLKGFIYYKTSCDPSKEQCYLKKNGNIAWYPPVENCEQASQWFQLSDTDSQTSQAIPVTKAQCPLACYAN